MVARPAVKKREWGWLRYMGSELFCFIADKK